MTEIEKYPLKRELLQVDIDLDGQQPLDDSIADLVRVMNSLPGIVTTGSCSGHGREPAMIFFKIRGSLENQGLFVLTRAIDLRYSKVRWAIELSVGDVVRDGILPTTFLLKSVENGETVEQASAKLIGQLNDLVNHGNFLKAFEIDLNQFALRDGEEKRDAGPCLDPDKMNGAGDGFGGSDY